MGYLDKDGLAHLWGKITNYVAQNGGGTVDWENVNGRPDLSSVSSMKVAQIVLLAIGWASDNTQMIDVAGILADENQQLIIPVPKSESKSAYISAGIECVSQAADSLTFQCASAPAEDIRVNVFVFGAAEVGEEFVGEFVWWSPQMTSDTTPAPYVASASSVYNSSFPAWKAFYGVATTDAYGTGGMWTSVDNVGSAYIQFDFGAPAIIKGLKINPQYADPSDPMISCPKRFYVSGSADGEKWNVIAEFNNIAWAGMGGYTEFEFEKPVRYRYFRIGAKDITSEESFLGRIAYGDIQFLILQQGGAS